VAHLLEKQEDHVLRPRQKLARPLLKINPGIVVHTFNPSYSGGGGRWILAWGQLGQSQQDRGSNGRVRKALSITPLSPKKYTNNFLPGRAT
jgi:hypothetical protein